MKGQSNVALKYFGITVHPFGDRMYKLQPYRLDKKAHFVLNFGALASYEKFIWEDIVSVKVIQGIFSDCSAGPAGASFIGLKGNIINNGNHRLSFGLGPILVYRRNWNRFPEYKSSGTFEELKSKTFGDIQYKFYLYGAEFEYDRRLSQKLDFSVTFTPGLPYVLTWSAGLKYWFNKKFTKKVKLYIPK